ncbi:MAG TPA: 3'-5' exoribonuclease [Solirubrobacteraceae bacterium]|nr:3'-5' exoribonuclease [Solirubrobacteraceae bacterium]
MSERADIYFSLDIEADGPIPGRYSMLAFGLAVAARFDGTTFEKRDPTAETFYRELQPISEEFDTAALEVSDLDRGLLVQLGAEPASAMTEAAAWIEHTAGHDRPVVVAFPACYDWLFLYWYLVTYSDKGSPFGFSSCLDMKTMLQQRENVVMDKAGLNDLPPAVRASRPHTHNALDDAVEQAEIFQHLWTWRR